MMMMMMVMVISDLSEYKISHTQLKWFIT